MKKSVIKYLKDTYGLNPGDLDLKATDTKEEVDRLAKKFGLTKKSDMTPEMAANILKRFY